MNQKKKEPDVVYYPFLVSSTVYAPGQEEGPVSQELLVSWESVVKKDFLEVISVL